MGKNYQLRVSDELGEALTKAGPKAVRRILEDALLGKRAAPDPLPVVQFAMQEDSKPVTKKARVVQTVVQPKTMERKADRPASGIDWAKINADAERLKAEKEAKDQARREKALNPSG